MWTRRTQALHILPDDDLQTTLQTQPNTVDGVDPSYNETFSFKVSSTQLSEAKARSCCQPRRLGNVPARSLVVA